MGMLERAPACLEQGGRRFLGIPPRQIRSKRALHSAFWAHGAGEINLPSWWIALLQRPPPETSATSQSIADTARKCLSAGLADGGFLDFLYPAKTLSLIHKLAVRDGQYLQNRQKLLRPQSTRAYSNGASEGQSDDFQYPNPNLPLTTDRQYAESLVSAIQTTSDATASQERATPRVKVRKDTTAASVSVRRAQVRELWEQATGSEHGRIQDVECDASSESLHRLYGVQQAALKECSIYLGKLLESSGRSLGIRYFSATIKAYFHTYRYTAIIRLYEEALDRHQDHEATPTLMRLAIDFENWTLALRAYLQYRRTPQDESYFWKEIANTDPELLMERTLKMGQYAIRRLQSYSEAEAPEGLRDFAITFIEKAFDCHSLNTATAASPRVSELVFDKLIWLMGSKSLTYDRYRSIIHHFLKFEPNSKAALAENGFRAIRLYHQMRQNSQVYPEQELVEQVLLRSCKMHHRSSKAIYDDLKSLYGIPSREVIHTVLKELEYQTDVKGFYQIFDDARQESHMVWSSDILCQIIGMFSNRRQPAQAQIVFDSVVRLTGEQPQFSHWKALIAAYANDDDISKAREKLVNLLETGADIDIQLYEPLFKFFARRGDVMGIDALLETIEEKDIDLQDFVIDSYVQAHIENQQLEEAETTLERSLRLDVQGSRTPMWGQLAIAYARLRMQNELEALRERMREAHIPEGDGVCQALIISHTWNRKPFRALRVITRMLPDLDIAATSYHYALVISGFISMKKPDIARQTETYMLDRGVAHDFSTKTLRIKAAARRDAGVFGEDWGKLDGERFARRGEAALGHVLQASERGEMGVMHDQSLLGLRHANYKDAFAGNYFLQLLPLYSERGAWKRAAQLYDRYIAYSRSLSPEQPPEPPVKLIGWLMGAFRHSGEFDEVEKGWKLAIDKAAEMAAQEGADRTAPGWVLPARRFHLAVPMLQYMLALFDTRQFAAVETLLADVDRMGFGVDSRNWNAYVQGHAAVGDPHLAFTTAERELMSGWRGWPDRDRLRPRHLIGQLDWWHPREHETLRRMPTYKTMVLLARAYTRLQEQWIVEGRRTEGLRELLEVAPTAVEEATLLPRINDRFQRAYLLNL